MRFRHENQECRRMNSERDMKVHTDQKRIIMGVILTLMCLFLCAGGVMGCVSVLQNGHRLNSITPDSIRQTMDDILAWQYEEYGVSDAQELLDAIYAKRAENGTVVFVESPRLYRGGISHDLLGGRVDCCDSHGFYRLFVELWRTYCFPQFR